MASHVKTLPSAHSVDSTIARLERALTEHGIKVFARIDQAAEAAAVGLHMPPTVLLVFGSPRAGTPIMVGYPIAGLDLPLKALAWQDADGKTWLSANDVGLLTERHGVPAEVAAPLARVDAVLEAAAGGPA
ncbi:MAG TPA: DUF302 domain-containing protein [Kofleriaceae bacterium]|jgi:uncharacterized protein (DUF302 family)|nr:DUF302 domain-containing protein [Kofleriaceae bacterium]